MYRTARRWCVGVANTAVSVLGLNSRSQALRGLTESSLQVILTPAQPLSTLYYDTTSDLFIEFFFIDGNNGLITTGDHAPQFGGLAAHEALRGAGAAGHVSLLQIQPVQTATTGAMSAESH